MFSRSLYLPVYRDADPPDDNKGGDNTDSPDDKKDDTVIEIDGEHHCTEEGKQYDSERDSTLESYGLTVMRIKNSEVMENFESVCMRIKSFI